MLKSIRVLFLVALIHIFFGSCILWKESFLSLKQANLYFLFLIMGVSAICAGINYLYTSDQINHSILYTQKKVWLLYALLLVINLLATCLVLSENIEMSSQIQKDLLDLFLPSFFFLLGIDMWIFLPFEKYFRDLYNFYNKKMGLVSVLASVILLRNPKTIFSICLYIGVGLVCSRYLFPMSILREISFYSHVIRDLLFVLCVLVFF